MARRRYFDLFIFLVLASVFTGSVQAQEVFHHPGIFFAPARQEWSDQHAQGLRVPGQFHLDVTLGSSFSSLGHAGSLFSQSLAPVLSYQASKKLSIQTGAVLSAYQSNTLFRQDLSGTGMGLHGYFLFASGTYQLNQNLRLSGMVYREHQPSFSPLFGTDRSMDFQGMRMDLDFRITEGLSLGARFNYSNRPARLFPGGFSPGSDPGNPWFW